MYIIVVPCIRNAIVQFVHDNESTFKLLNVYYYDNTYHYFIIISHHSR